VTREIWLGELRAPLLGYLAQDTPELVGETLEAARAIQNEESRASVLSGFTQYLPKEALGKLLKATRDIRDGESRARVLSALTQRLPEEAREALAVVWAIQEKESRSDILSELAYSMTNLLPKEIYFLLENSLVILSHRTRADLFSDLAALMPVIIHIGDEDTPREIYSAVRDVTTWWP
jgi:hypothetical protein